MMDDITIFYIGVFVMVLFLAGIFYTVREFRSMYKEQPESHPGNQDGISLK